MCHCHTHASYVNIIWILSLKAIGQARSCCSPVFWGWDLGIPGHIALPTAGCMEIPELLPICKPTTSWWSIQRFLPTIQLLHQLRLRQSKEVSLITIQVQICVKGTFATLIQTDLTQILFQSFWVSKCCGSLRIALATTCLVLVWFSISSSPLLITFTMEERLNTRQTFGQT